MTEREYYCKDNKNIQEERKMRGTVKWFNAQKGYGFVTTEDGTDYFVHHSQIKMDGFRKLDEGDIVEFDIRSEEKGIAAVDVLPVLTLGMMKQKAAKEHLHLEVALVKGYDNRGWMIVDGNNFIVAGKQGMSLEELNDYFTE